MINMKSAVKDFQTRFTYHVSLLAKLQNKVAEYVNA
jgi:hypothetical protein